MSILDGFLFWLGKILAEFFIALVILIAFGWLVYHFEIKQKNRRRNGQ